VNLGSTTAFIEDVIDLIFSFLTGIHRFFWDHTESSPDLNPYLSLGGIQK